MFGRVKHAENDTNCLHSWLRCANNRLITCFPGWREGKGEAMTYDVQYKCLERGHGESIIIEACFLFFQDLREVKKKI